jgi:hypothetical protein
MVIKKGRAPLVAGTPAQTARLRPLRNPLYDTELMVAAAAVARIELFVNRRTFANGAVKNLNDTNMEADGVLGLPLEFDLIGLTGKLNYDAAIADITAFYNEGVLQWFFHQSVPWLQIPVTEIPGGVGPWGFTTVAATTIFSNGLQQANNFFNMTDHLRQARHILSMESFRGVIQFPTAITPAANILYKLLMQGILYAAL